MERICLTPYRAFDGKTILITGGSGSFGRSFAKILLEQSTARRIVIYSRDEFKQYEMQQDLKDPRIGAAVLYRRRAGRLAAGAGDARSRYRDPRGGVEACAGGRI